MRRYIYIISAISLFLVSACGADTNEDTATKEDNNNESEVTNDQTDNQNDSEDETESSSNTDDIDDSISVEERIEEIVINIAGSKKSIGNDRFQDMNAWDEEGENLSEENLDKETKDNLRDTQITILIYATEKEIETEKSLSLYSAQIMQELYDTYSPGEVSINWSTPNNSEIFALYVLKKQAESELDWDKVFINDDQVNESFTRDIDSFKSTSPQYIESK